MSKTISKMLSCVLALMVVITGVVPSIGEVSAATTDLKITSVKVVNTETGAVVADLMAGQKPKLNVGTTYSLDVDYNIPQELRNSDTYFTATLGNGLYFKSLPGATFTQGPITATGFEELVKTPTGTGTSPYNYPTAGSSKARSGEVTYKTKKGLDAAASHKEMIFTVDEAYVNQDKNQVLADDIKVRVGTSTTNATDSKSYDVIAADEFTYAYWNDQSSEVISKGNTTSIIQTSTSFSHQWQNISDKALTKANSKTTVEIVYPKDVELVGLEETGLYHANGTVESTTIVGDNKVSVVSWNEPGSYSGGLTFKPHIKVDANSTRANGSSFNVQIKNLHKTVWNDTQNAGRTSKNNVANLTVQLIDGSDPESIKSRTTVQSAPNWSYKKNDSYNVRLGSLLIKNDLAIPSRKAKTIEMKLDTTNKAIIRGVTIPYKAGMTYGPIHWTASDGTSGTADPSILETSGGVSALIKNTKLGLDINTSIKSIKVDIGKLPAGYDGIRPNEDLLDGNKLGPGEFYGWSYIPAGVFGTWKKGEKDDVISTISFYNSDETPTAADTVTTKATSRAPEVLNGVGNINKTQVLGGDEFKITGRINDANWDWNPLQEPVLYVMMPEGFNYKDLTITNGTLGSPKYVGEYRDVNGTPVRVWKYNVDIGSETRGQYQPDFSIKSMNMSMTVTPNENAAKGTYHINDFFAFTTKDFKEIDAVIKPEKWDRSNWSTNNSRYAKTENGKAKSVFDNKVNSGEFMVSLSEGPGVTVQQAAAVRGDSKLLVEDKTTGENKEYKYDPTSAETKTDTTPVLKRGDKATLRVTLRNNAAQGLDHANVFVPLLKKDANYGQSFNPEGKSNVPLKLDSVSVSPNFRVEYIKLHPGKTYNVNKAPSASDYDVVTDPADADMVHLVSTKPLAEGDGGSIDVVYKVASDLSYDYNEKIDVLSPVLDYDISGNKSITALAASAITVSIPEPEKVEVSGTKTWVDANDQDGKRPSSITVKLYADGNDTGKTATANAAGNWNYSFGRVLKYDDSNREIKYTVKEVAVDGYTSKVTGYNIENTHKVEKTTVSGKKTWDDANDQDGIRPNGVTFKLYADGVDTGKTATADASSNWKYKFENLDKYKAGNVVAYTVKEASVNEYTAVQDGFNFTNKHTPYTRSVKVTKKWANDVAGDRPSSIKVRLMADGTEVADKTVTPDANGDWKAEFDNLPVNKDGNKIKYTVKEDQVQDYTVTYTGDVDNGYIITNTHIEKPKPSKTGKKLVKRHGPKTGDMTNIMLYGVVLLVAVLGLLIAVIKRRNK